MPHFAELLLRTLMVYKRLLILNLINTIERLCKVVDCSLLNISCENDKELSMTHKQSTFKLKLITYFKVKVEGQLGILSEELCLLDLHIFQGQLVILWEEHCLLDLHLFQGQSSRSVRYFVRRAFLIGPSFISRSKFKVRYFVSRALLIGFHLHYKFLWSSFIS